MRWEETLRSKGVSDSVIKTVSSNLHRITSGSHNVLLTPLGEKTDLDSLVESFKSEVLGDMRELPDIMQEVELAQLSKFGPRSIAKPWKERKEKTLQYFNYPWKDEVSYTPKTNGMLSPLSAENAILHLPNSTSAGLPTMGKKSEHKDEVLKHLDEWLEREFPCMLFTRTQEGGKTRDVFGEGFAQVLQESRFYRPYLKIAKALPWRKALLGPDEVDEGITKLMRYAFSKGLTLTSVDFSAFDHSVGPSLQTASFNLIKSYFPVRFWDEIDLIATRFRTVGLVTPDGIWEGEHGVPSGSAFTNEIDSIAQYLCVRRFYEEAIEAPFQIQGDDGAYAVEEPDGLFNGFRQAGLSVNEEKSVISTTYISYLQRVYHEAFTDDFGIIRGAYPVSRALNRLVHLERWTDLKNKGITGVDFFNIRAIGILENCKHNPLFPKLVKFILDRDKHQLKFSARGLAQYVRHVSDSGNREIVNQYSDDVKGLSSFSTVKLIGELIA